jgi:hypothetical protein
MAQAQLAPLAQEAHSFNSSSGAGAYLGAWFYSSDSPYERFLLREINSEHGLRLQPQDLLIDLGGGSGRFAGALDRSLLAGSQGSSPAEAEKRGGLERPPMVIDPSPGLAEQATHERVDFSHADAVGWLESAASHEAIAGAMPRPVKLLVKEAVHLIGETALGSALGRALASVAAAASRPVEARLVIMTRVQDSSHLPLMCPTAHRRWREQQNLAADIAGAIASTFPSLLHDAEGRAKARCRLLAPPQIRPIEFPVAIRRSHWRQFLLNRVWSCLTAVPDEEMARGIEQLDQLPADSPLFAPHGATAESDPSDPTIYFPDRIVLIVMEFEATPSV